MNRTRTIGSLVLAFLVTLLFVTSSYGEGSARQAPKPERCKSCCCGAAQQVTDSSERTNGIGSTGGCGGCRCEIKSNRDAPDGTLPSVFHGPQHSPVVVGLMPSHQLPIRPYGVSGRSPRPPPPRYEEDHLNGIASRAPPETA